MDMYQKRKMRKENQNTNIEDNKSIAKTNINCPTTVFPILLKNPVK